MSLSIKEISKLKTKKYREQFQTTLLEGEHLVLELEKSSCESAEILCTENHAHIPTSFPKRILTSKQFSEISDVKTPQGIAALVPYSELYRSESSTSRQRKKLYFSELQDPGNLGTIIRTAAWFQNCEVALSPNSTDPYSPKVIRSTMGGCLHVPVTQNFEIETKKADPKTVACLDMKAPPIWDAPLEEISVPEPLRKTFETDGYVVLRGFLTAPEVADFPFLELQEWSL